MAPISPPSPSSQGSHRSAKILLADDHEVVRMGTRMLLKTIPGWGICAEASSGREAVALAEKHQPDIAVVDLAMPELNGVETTRQIKQVAPNCEVLVVSGSAHEPGIHRAFAAGARSFVPKHEASIHLVKAVEALLQHQPYFTPEIAEIVFNRVYSEKASPNAGGDSAADLTQREREIVQLLAEGKSNKEVAALLSISERTVETHRATVMKKLHLNSMVDLVRFAVRARIIEA